jgi:hypothetical protein
VNELSEGSAGFGRAAGRKLRIQGQEWLIYEIASTAMEPASLVFETDLTVRRVKRYPANWRTLDEATLLALSWKR